MVESDRVATEGHPYSCSPPYPPPHRAPFLHLKLVAKHGERCYTPPRPTGELDLAFLLASVIFPSR